jgi:hypothetical protein
MKGRPSATSEDPPEGEAGQAEGAGKDLERQGEHAAAARGKGIRFGHAFFSSARAVR